MAAIWKDRLIGAAIAIFTGVAATLLIAWLDSPKNQEGIILYVDKEYAERTVVRDKPAGHITSKSELQVIKYGFYNLQTDLENFEIYIPTNFQTGESVFVETKSSNAILNNVSDISDMLLKGRSTIKIRKINKGGYFELYIKSSIKHEPTNFLPETDTPDIRVLSPETLHIYL